MIGPVCNTTLEKEYINEVPIFHGMTFHRIGLIVSALFALIATAVSSWLIFMHATHYSKPYIQRHIIRILFMVPIYSIVSFLSFLYYRHAVYFEVIMGCYEAFAIASFFTLLCHFVAPTLHDQKEYFRGVVPKDWVWPMNWLQKCTGGKNGILRTPRSGLTWFNIIFLSIFQYCFIRVAMTITAVVSQAFGRYCEASLHPAFAHIWTLVLEALAVTVAMYCLIQFYIQLREDLAHHRPFLKVLCIKLVIFFSFWQSLLISVLTSTHTLKPSEKINYSDFKIGIPSMLLCIEMAIFAIMHIFAFSYKEYRITQSSATLDGSPGYKGGPLGWKAYMDAYNPWDIIKAVGRSFRWLMVGRRKRLDDISYKNHADSLSLEPTRSSETEYVGVQPKVDYALGGVGTGGKQGRYQPLQGDESGDALLHSHPNPSGPTHSYPPPPPQSGFAGPTVGSGDLGDQPTAQRWDGYSNPDQLTASHPMPGPARPPAGQGNPAWGS